MSMRGSEGRSESLAFKLVMYLVLLTGAIPIILPFYWMVSASLKTKERVQAYPPDWLPVVPKSLLAVGEQELLVKVFDDGDESGTHVSRVKFISGQTPLYIPAENLRTEVTVSHTVELDGRERRVEPQGPADADGMVTVNIVGSAQTTELETDAITAVTETLTYWTVLGVEARVTIDQDLLPLAGSVSVVSIDEMPPMRVAPELLGTGADAGLRAGDGRLSADVVARNEAAGYMTVRLSCPSGGINVPVTEMRQAFKTRHLATIDGEQVEVKRLATDAAMGRVTVEIPSRPVSTRVPAAELKEIRTTSHHARILDQDVAVELDVPEESAETLTSVMVRTPDALAIASSRIRSEAPFRPQWHNFALAWKEQRFDVYLANTMLIASLVVLGTVFSCGLVGYAFARLQFRGRNVLFLILLSTMMIPGQVTSIPTFVMFATVGWIDSFLPLIVPSFLSASAFFVFLYRQFMMTIPTDLEDSARIDGCGPLATWWLIMMPLSKPIIVTVAVFSFIGSWNDFLGPLLYINSDQKQTIALGLQSFKSAYQFHDPQVLMAASVMMLIPTIVLFFLAQKAFIRGVVVSGVKG
ncbi:MAG: ABC transporter permease subunit [Phycisphaerae bacterium]|nr:ABC transporter permease subunit [Phycisphaerae bacterium]